MNLEVGKQFKIASRNSVSHARGQRFSVESGYSMYPVVVVQLQTNSDFPSRRINLFSNFTRTEKKKNSGTG